MRQAGNKLHVVVNDVPVLEFDRSQAIPGHQRLYLNNMDVKMDQGITLDGTFHPTPDPIVRSHFVANSMVNALFVENYSLAMALCTWLADRIPDLQIVKAVGNIEADMGIELVFDRDYTKAKTEQGIKFYKP
ncbi:hypothetical protein SAMN05660964_01886 [Thiothrix caldifontis]|uniref:Uncharacterized protein n=1 Tax=Thiothrix caldifontis TaxID=525918 RepID=A0A1H4C6U0_9GAMM|nr:hypothetical protein [Thiothrix caldifontis]SEA56104.1 hypothetical protein SAMN05660964_01886 [Thiothrix caldifontis]